MQPDTTLIARPAHPDAADWEWRIRRNDGAWLARPERRAGEAPSNAEPWDRIIPHSWAFDHPRDAIDAAASHGVDAEGCALIKVPRRPGEWLAVSSDPRVAATSPYGRKS